MLVKVLFILQYILQPITVKDQPKQIRETFREFKPNEAYCLVGVTFLPRILLLRVCFMGGWNMVSDG